MRIQKLCLLPYIILILLCFSNALQQHPRSSLSRRASFQDCDASKKRTITRALDETARRAKAAGFSTFQDRRLNLWQENFYRWFRTLDMRNMEDVRNRYSDIFKAASHTPRGKPTIVCFDVERKCFLDPKLVAYVIRQRQSIVVVGFGQTSRC